MAGPQGGEIPPQSSQDLQLCDRQTQTAGTGQLQERGKKVDSTLSFKHHPREWVKHLAG